ncbi:TetR/AcrR family transcriptional regulator [Sphingobium nicotianae]|uniref:TetR/AcrR family transcriptional regulator n=1 Tax=Sphingobium nicotianae TaxID=2782607 RepID=A0A9X1IQD6_9SPHN|nr:TetR/AcrR family transcriptional regulator [Sphingobium nicotianae]MBT2186584.1 TetR/AcrR family transcriptional regulator [Sphingobium nicotianae]
MIATQPNAPETRGRILDAAADLLAGGKVASMAEIARTAGVSRQTVYLHFGDRRHLFGDLISHFIRRSGFSQPVTLPAAQPARDTFDQFFRHFVHVVWHVGPALRPLWAAMAADDEIIESVKLGDALVTAAFHRLFARLEEEGCLAPIWTATEAAEAAWSMSLYWLTVGHMRAMRGWSEEEIVSIQLKMLRATFLRAL